jgi:hypothetical protein
MKRIQKLFFEDTYIILVVDRQKLRVNISSASIRLLRAKEKDRMNFRFSPGGHTVTWPTLTLEMSVNSLLQMATRYWT